MEGSYERIRSTDNLLIQSTNRQLNKHGATLLLRMVQVRGGWVANNSLTLARMLWPLVIEVMGLNQMSSRLSPFLFNSDDNSVLIGRSNSVGSTMTRPS